MTTAIKTVNLTKSFGSVFAIKDINLEIRTGEIFAFLGPNGAGKTTTVKIFSGLLKQSAGKVFICGIDTEKDPVAVKMIVGVVPDHPFIYPKLTGMEFLRLVGNIYGIGRDEQDVRIKGLLEVFGLGGFAGNLVETYSLGMRQKLVITSVLLHRPQVLILDEPLVGLDPKSARMVKDMLVKLSREGVTIFMCTHILEIAERLAHRIGIINNGAIVVVGTKEELQSMVTKAGTLEDIYLDITA
ncbi:MAG: ABC transporter ATP-binding protein [Elusimicrobia bacterium]|nr:ABC transporter ATP-binding protein [Elusimicrobiota bacterium]